jgi:hypothetical protein
MKAYIMHRPDLLDKAAVDAAAAANPAAFSIGTIIIPASAVPLMVVAPGSTVQLAVVP